MIKGFDCYHGNDINWDLVKQYFQFVFIKASQGETYHDITFQSNWKAARDNGLYHGGYHFWEAQADPIKQCDNFLSRGVDWSLPMVLPPVIDIENQVGTAPGQSAALDRYILQNKAKCSDNALTLLEQVALKTGRKPVVYCSPHFLFEYLGASVPFGKYSLWIAGYQPSVPKLPAGFTDWLFWQYSQFGTQHGAMSGADLDLNYFNGDINQLKLI